MSNSIYLRKDKRKDVFDTCGMHLMNSIQQQQYGQVKVQLGNLLVLLDTIFYIVLITTRSGFLKGPLWPIKNIIFLHPET